MLAARRGTSAPGMFRSGRKSASAAAVVSAARRSRRCGGARRVLNRPSRGRGRRCSCSAPAMSAAPWPAPWRCSISASAGSTSVGRSSTCAIGRPDRDRGRSRIGSARSRRRPLGAACVILTHSHALDSLITAAALERGTFSLCGLDRLTDEAPSLRACVPRHRHSGGANSLARLPDRRPRHSGQASRSHRRPDGGGVHRSFRESCRAWVGVARRARGGHGAWACGTRAAQGLSRAAPPPCGRRSRRPAFV